MERLGSWHPTGATRSYLALILALFFLGLGVRLLDLTDAPFDFHPTRQLRDALIARGTYYRLSPHADPSLRSQAMTLGDTGEELEPPILETMVALTYVVIGGEHLWVARIYSVLFWLVGGLALYKLASRHVGPAGGATALAFYLLLPYGAIASRSFQPDPFMVMWMLLAIWRLDAWAEHRQWRDAALAGLFAGLAVLVKPVAAIIVGPALMAVVLSEQGFMRCVKDRQVWTMAGLSIGLPLLFYGLIYAPSSSLTGFWGLDFSGLLRQPTFYFSWLRLLSDIVDVGIIFLAAAGVLLTSGRFRWLLIAMWLGYILIGLLFPYHIQTHDYYSLPVIPIAALSLAVWGEMAVERARQLAPVWKAALVGLVIIVAGYYLWMARVAVVGRDYRGKAAEYQRIGQALPGDGQVLALMGDYGFPLAYYGWRHVSIWPGTVDLEMAELRNSPDSKESFEDEFAEKTNGVRYFLVTQMGELDAQPLLKQKLYSEYAIVEEGDDYILFDLQRPPANP